MTPFTKLAKTIDQVLAQYHSTNERRLPLLDPCYSMSLLIIRKVTIVIWIRRMEDLENVYYSDFPIVIRPGTR